LLGEYALVVFPTINYIALRIRSGIITSSLGDGLWQSIGT
jgi:hypothetical protein